MAELTKTSEFRIPMTQIISHLRGGFPLPKDKEIQSVYIDDTGDEYMKSNLVVKWIEKSSPTETREASHCDRCDT